MAGITEAELDELMRAELPWAVDMGLRVERLGEGACRVRLPFDPSYVRPGGTVAGPMMIAAASFALYAAVLSAYGPVKQTVARQLSCNFLRAAAPADLLADARLLHRGARAAYGEAALYSAVDDVSGFFKRNFTQGGKALAEDLGAGMASGGTSSPQAGGIAEPITVAQPFSGMPPTGAEPSGLVPQPE